MPYVLTKEGSLGHRIMLKLAKHPMTTNELSVVLNRKRKHIHIEIGRLRSDGKVVLSGQIPSEKTRPENLYELKATHPYVSRYIMKDLKKRKQ